MRKPLKQSQNIRWNYYIARSELHPANWIHFDTLWILAMTLVNQVILMKCNALPTNLCSCCPKELNQYPCMLSICFKPNYMLCWSFLTFVLVRLQQTMGLPSLCLFSLVMLMCTVTACSSSAAFFCHISSYFQRNKVILPSFLVRKNGPSNQRRTHHFSVCSKQHRKRTFYAVQ